MSLAPEFWTDSDALSRRLQAIATRYAVTRLTGPGNPMKTEMLRHGAAIATKVPFVPGNAFMNTIHGLEDPAALPPILEFYAATRQPCWIELYTHNATPELGQALIAHGFTPQSQNAVLLGPADARGGRVRKDVEVHDVAPAELELFLQVLARGFDTPEGILAGVVRNQHFWGDVPEWRLLLARVGGEPAGAAVVALTDGGAYLASGSTLPAFRSRGVHTALVARRLEIAQAEGCHFVTGRAAFGSASHRNQRRAGLELVLVQQTWLRPSS
jgi:GNAT superfamily N-acetyltransferase